MSPHSNRRVTQMLQGPYCGLGAAFIVSQKKVVNQERGSSEVGELSLDLRCYLMTFLAFGCGRWGSAKLIYLKGFYR